LRFRPLLALVLVLLCTAALAATAEGGSVRGTASTPPVIPASPPPSPTCPAGTVEYSGTCVLVVVVPQDAHVDATGKGWQCDAGFYRTDGKCAAVPPNSVADAAGNGFTCSPGFDRSGSQCLPEVTQTPALTQPGNSGACGEGYYRSGDRCVKNEIPF